MKRMIKNQYRWRDTWCQETSPRTGILDEENVTYKQYKTVLSQADEYNFMPVHKQTHTHTHTHIYIYIYICHNDS